MKKFLKNKKGVTILEGLIALTLLALVATGTFAVLLSTSRKSSEPDIREEMALAVERATHWLQAYIVPDGTNLDQVWCGDNGSCTRTLTDVLCPEEDGSGNAVTPGQHGIKCKLPPICDKSQSDFYYILNESSYQFLPPADADQAKTNGVTDVGGEPLRTVEFYIKCNGFTL